MRAYVLERRQVVPRRVADIFPFFADAANLDLLTPSWMRFEIRTPLPVTMQAGLLLDYRIRWRGIPLRWRTLIEEWHPNERFVDRQIRGPYRLWHHTHLFEPHPSGTLMTDIVRYALPFGLLGRIAHGFSVRRDVAAIFDYRYLQIERLFPAAFRA